MTLIQIAEAMDAQLARLHKVRAIVATLLPAETTSPLPTVAAKAELSPEPQPAQEASAIPEPQPRKPRMGKLSKPRLPHVAVRVRSIPPTALNGTIPQGPIAVSAADAVRSRPVEVAPARAVPTPAEPGHSLDDLVRQLTGRTAPGLPARINTN